MESEDELISGWPDLASGAGTKLQILCYDVTSMMFHASLKLGRREKISHISCPWDVTLVKYQACTLQCKVP